MKQIPGTEGCTNHSCLFGHPGGMGTTGGCSCFEGLNPRAEAMRIRRNVQCMRGELERVEEQLTALRTAAEEMLHATRVWFQSADATPGDGGVEAMDRLLAAERALAGVLKEGKEEA